jgi:acyl-CoA synthetase (AMP-forming)/AMP-acid ligase II
VKPVSVDEGLGGDALGVVGDEGLDAGRRAGEGHGAEAAAVEAVEPRPAELEGEDEGPVVLVRVREGEERPSDVIDTGGVKVNPVEVEAALEAHPDVAEAAVVGVPDAAWSG